VHTVMCYMFVCVVCKAESDVYVVCMCMQSEMFQSDIYPPTASTQPSLQAAEWVAGMNCGPHLLSLKVSPAVSDQSQTGYFVTENKQLFATVIFISAVLGHWKDQSTKNSHILLYSTQHCLHNAE